MTPSRTLPSSRTGHLSSTDLMMLLTASVWGINFVAVKISLSEFSPLAFNAVRFSLATLIMATIMRLRGESFHLSRRDTLLMIILGLVGHSVYQVVFISGMARTNTANSSLLLATSPIFVVIYSHFLRVERNTLQVWLGVLLSFSGSLFLVLGGSDSLNLRDGSALGDLLMLGAAMLWAAYTTLSKPLLARHSPIKVTTMSMMAGLPVMVLMSLPQIINQSWTGISREGWGGLVYSASLALALGYVLWSTGVHRVGNARTAVYQNAVPVVAIIVAWIVLGDRLTPLQAVGAVVVLAGIIVTRAGRRKQRTSDR